MRTRKFSLMVVFVLFALAVSGVRVSAQYTSGIDGTIFDQSGAVVPVASVTIKNVETGIAQSQQTTSAGYYRFVDLAAAAYTITVSAPGFETMVQPEFRIEVTQVRTVNITLQLGQKATTVTVTAPPPPVETSQGRVSGLVGDVEVHELPLVGRNFYTLVDLTPGVTGVPAGGGQSYSQATGDIFTTEYGVALNANGQRGISNEYSCDGASVNNVCHGGLTNFSPAADAVQEVRVAVNSYSAETGRHSSVSVNTITKQGTNLFHGTMSEFHTDNVFQSRNIFQTPTGPVFRRNEGAATFGGPIRKDKTFFFGSIDFLRSGVGYGYPAVVSTPSFINYMSQNYPNNISTLLMTKFPAAFTPVSNFNTAGSVLGVDCSTLASPSSTITTPVGALPCNYAVTGQGNLSTTVPRNGLQYGFRVDHSFNNDKDRIYGTMYRTTIQTTLFNTPSPYPAFTFPWNEDNRFSNASETHIFSPTVVNELGISYNRTHGSGFCYTECYLGDISTIGMPDYGIGSLAPGVFVQNNYELREMLAFNRGEHNLKVGVFKQNTQDYDDFGRSDIRPHWQFNTIFDFATDKPEYEYNVGINPLTAAPLDPSAGYIDDQLNSFASFIQDDWKAKPNLTLNLGLRWDIFENPNFRHNHAENIIFNGGSNFFEQIANSSVDYTANHRLYERTQFDNIGPKFGFAWDPTKRGKFAIRGGIAQFFTRIPTCNMSASRSNPPNWANVTASIYTPPVVPVYGLSASNVSPYSFPRVTGIVPGLDPKNGLLAGKAAMNAVDPYTMSPYAFNWSLGGQYAMTSNWVVEAYYIGSVGHHLLDNYDVNRVDDDLITNNNVLTRLNTSFGPIYYSQTLANSFYTGATVDVKKRMSHGVNMQVAYTLGKGLDSTDIGGGGNESNVNLADIYNIRKERGLSVFDIRNRIAGAAVWALPRPQFGSSYLNWFASGWQLSGITILQSGSPYSVTCATPFEPIYNASGAIVGNSGCDYNADGANYDYPMTPSWGNSRSGSRSRYITGLFTQADFPAPPLGQEGNLGRDTFIGPGFANTDFSVMKTSKIPWFIGKEGATLEIRGEIFNVFNRVNLGQVDGGMSDGSLFGTSNSTFGSRDIQFGLRIRF